MTYNVFGGTLNLTQSIYSTSRWTTTVKTLMLRIMQRYIKHVTHKHKQQLN